MTVMAVCKLYGGRGGGGKSVNCHRVVSLVLQNRISGEERVGGGLSPRSFAKIRNGILRGLGETDS
jgi:hypothetical protein